MVVSAAEGGGMKFPQTEKLFVNFSISQHPNSRNFNQFYWRFHGCAVRRKIFCIFCWLRFHKVEERESCKTITVIMWVLTHPRDLRDDEVDTKTSRRIFCEVSREFINSTLDARIFSFHKKWICIKNNCNIFSLSIILV